MAAALGLQLIVHSPYHWQVRGGRFIVNYYPTKDTIYVNGTHSAKGCQIKGDFARALRLANEAPPVGRSHAERHGPKWIRRMRRKLYASHPYCFICGVKFNNPREATLEHIIPLARGGSHGEDNLALSHQSCNLAKGHDLKEPPTQGA